MTHKLQFTSTPTASLPKPIKHNNWRIQKICKCNFLPIYGVKFTVYILLKAAEAVHKSIFHHHVCVSNIQLCNMLHHWKHGSASYDPKSTLTYIWRSYIFKNIELNPPKLPTFHYFPVICGSSWGRLLPHRGFTEENWATQLTSSHN